MHAHLFKTSTAGGKRNPGGIIGTHRYERFAEHVDGYKVVRMAYRAWSPVLAPLHLIYHLVIACTGDVLMSALRGPYLGAL